MKILNVDPAAVPAVVASVLAAGALALLAAPGAARAGENDFVLHRFLARSDGDGSSQTCQGGAVVNCIAGVQRQRPYDRADATPNPVIAVIPDEEAFGAFVQEIGIALAPRLLEPSETLGQAGFSMGLATTVSDIREKDDHWIRAMPDVGDTPPGALTSLALQMRKGLPFSFEIGGTLTHILQSEMYALGTDLKWALLDGLRIQEFRLPDLAVRGAVNRLVGNRDLDLTVAGGDVSASYVFPVGGVVQLTPYAGWSRLMIFGSSHVLDATPGIDGFPPPHCNVDPASDDRGKDPDGRPTEECVRALEGVETTDLKANFVLPQRRKDVSRLFGGLRAKFTVVSIVAEAAFADGLGAYSGKLEFDF